LKAGMVAWPAPLAQPAPLPLEAIAAPRPTAARRAPR
jgi:hypothetical protein